MVWAGIARVASGPTSMIRRHPMSMTATEIRVGWHAVFRMGQAMKAVVDIKNTQRLAPVRCLVPRRRCGSNFSRAIRVS